MQAELARYQVDPVDSEPTGLYAGQFPIFELALVGALKHVRAYN